MSLNLLGPFDFTNGPIASKVNNDGARIRKLIVKVKKDSEPSILDQETLLGILLYSQDLNSSFLF